MPYPERISAAGTSVPPRYGTPPCSPPITSSSIRYRGSALVAAIFSVPFTQAQSLVPAGVLTPLRRYNGDALLAISWAQHGDSDIGSYNDLSISVPVRNRHRHGLVSGLVDVFFAGGHKLAGFYVVDQLFSSLHGTAVGNRLNSGRSELSDIDFRWQGVHFCGVARAPGEQQVLSCLRGRSWPLLRLPRATLNLYHHNGSTLIQNRVRMDNSLHVHLGREMVLEVAQAEHPVSRLMRAVGVAGRQPLAMLTSWQMNSELLLSGPG